MSSDVRFPRFSFGQPVVGEDIFGGTLYGEVLEFSYALFMGRRYRVHWFNTQRKSFTWRSEDEIRLMNPLETLAVASARPAWAV